MHLFYRTLCLIQFAQIRTARPSDCGLDKETEPHVRRPSVGRELHLSFIHSFTPRHLFHSGYYVPRWEHKAQVQPGGGGRQLNRWLWHTSTHWPALVLWNRAREESLWRLRLFLEGRKNENCTTMHSNTQRISGTWGMNLRTVYILYLIF